MTEGHVIAWRYIVDFEEILYKKKCALANRDSPDGVIRLGTSVVYRYLYFMKLTLLSMRRLACPVIWVTWHHMLKLWWLWWLNVRNVMSVQSLCTYVNVVLQLSIHFMYTSWDGSYFDRVSVNLQTLVSLFPTVCSVMFTSNHYLCLVYRLEF